MLEIQEARNRILAVIRPLTSETVGVTAAYGRVLAGPVLAPIDLPGFDNSAMDGFALRSGDVAQASPAGPVKLRLRGTVPAGELFPGTVEPGTCVRIFTGSPLPRGADAVVMQEDCRSEPDEPEWIAVGEPAKPWENIRFRGEDVKRGATLAEAGSRLSTGRISLLAAVGLAEVTVGRRPRVGLLATGSELREPGQPLAPGQIYESNRAGLSVLLERAGALPEKYPLVRDDLAATRAALEKALTECDAVVTSGGVSVGELDFVKPAFQQLGGELEFWKVALKPGKPFAFGRWRDKFFFGLPGNPVSALVSFLVLVAPALARLQGAGEVAPAAARGILAEALENRGDRPHFVRVTLDANGRIRSAGVQASHILSSLAECNGLVEVPRQTTLAAGESVAVLQWD